MKRIKHNDLLPWFLEDHGTLPAGYLSSCRKFFESLKPQAGTGYKPQASSLTDSGAYDINRIIKEK
tara:strand:- start:11 stop:208 length:198 start_codon:yes stop_codon:yes gene_type:complete